MGQGNHPYWAQHGEKRKILSDRVERNIQYGFHGNYVTTARCQRGLSMFEDHACTIASMTSSFYSSQLNAPPV